ncbi:MAG: DUF5110 domain-containing protein [Bacteroidales bacterium]|nr:DUF5110 domain-containing protein [Bacteroidales bacterium]
MKYTAIIVLFFLSLTGYAQDGSNPVANPEAIIVEGNARFTVLTPRLIRIEYDSTAEFIDKSSFVIINRKLPLVNFQKSEKKGWLIIKTDILELKYKKGTGAFTADNLQISYLGNDNASFVWRPGAENTNNLKGTFRTLDGMDGDIHLWGEKKQAEFEEGLISRDGWYLIDDTGNFLFDSSDWNWVEVRANNETDWYFMGYGNDYKAVLNDFTLVAGKVPLPPRYAFGYWWSRYWNYSDAEFRDLINNFDRYNIPLDVLVIDMDWHNTDGLNAIREICEYDEFGQRVGWTGYTWNKSLFPEPDKFLQWTNDRQIKTTFNLHPASGIPPTEEKYNDFAKAVDFDTSGNNNIPFEAADKKYMENLFAIILDPMEEKGADFWWLDWQQWKESKQLPGLSNTWWLNYCFFTHMERKGEHRPLLYHRWGGLGNHRYQIGFSGDAIITWKSLEFQPYFTSTASNVLYGYWSHDLGGHMFGRIPEEEKKVDPELYTRWMQYGVFSPVFRTHSTKDPRLRKEVWNFSDEYFSELNDAINLRYALNPYIYTMARKTYDTGISLCRPMYYEYPEKEEAYSFRNEYMFGDDILIIPVTAPENNNFSDIQVWLPEGNDWYEWHTGTMFHGGQILERKFLLNEYPVYVKAGAVIPMYPEIKNLQQDIAELIVKVFPGGNYQTKFYEDNGDNDGYKKGEFAFTSFISEISPDGTKTVTVMPREGSFPGMNPARNYEIQLYGSVVPENVLVNGKKIVYSPDAQDNTWNYSGSDLTVHVYVHDISCEQKLEVKISYPDTSVNVNGMIGKMNRLRLTTDYLKNHWYNNAPLPAIVTSTNQSDLKIEYNPADFNRIVNDFNNNYLLIPDVISDIDYNPNLEKTTVEKCIGYLEK